MRYPCRPSYCWGAIVLSVICVPPCVVYSFRQAYGYVQGIRTRSEMVDLLVGSCGVPWTQPDEETLRRRERDEKRLEELLNATIERGLLSPDMVRELLISEDGSKSTAGRYLLPWLAPRDSIQVVRWWWSRCDSVELKRSILLPLAATGKPEYAELFAELMFHQDHGVRSDATYGLWRCAGPDEFLTQAVRSLERGLTVHFYGTREPLHRGDPSWKSAAAYFTDSHWDAVDEAFFGVLRGEPPPSIKADILRALIGHQSLVALEYCRSAISAEKDPAVWKYTALTILAYGTRDEKIRLLSQAENLPEDRLPLLAEAVRDQLVKFRLPFKWVEERPILANAVAECLKRSGESTGVHRHVLEHVSPATFERNFEYDDGKGDPDALPEAWRHQLPGQGLPSTK